MKYIGQATAPLKKQNKEHKNWCQKKRKTKQLLKSSKKNDGIAYHHHLTGHKIDFKDISILEKVYRPRLIKEEIKIKKLKASEQANMQAGDEMNPIWDMHLELREDFQAQKNASTK